MPSIVVETAHHSLQAAIDGALAQAEPAVRRALERRRMKPVKLRADEPVIAAAG
jgi:hypothetical protein